MTFAYCDDLNACECFAYRESATQVLLCYDRNDLHRNDTEWNSVDPTLDDQPMEPGPDHQEG